MGVPRTNVSAELHRFGGTAGMSLVCYDSGGTGTGSGAGGPAKNLDPCPNLLVEESDVFTHRGAGVVS